MGWSEEISCKNENFDIKVDTWDCVALEMQNEIDDMTLLFIHPQHCDFHWTLSLEDKRN